MTSKRRRSRVFVLGAGCSRAPVFGANRPTLPLIRDFISISTSLPLTNDYAPLWQFLEEVHGFTLADLQAGSPNIEQVLSLAEASAGMIWSGSRHDYFELFGRYFFLGNPAGYLKTLILETLNTLSAPLATMTCSHHDALVDSMGVGDVVITFNYDLIIDSSMRRSGRWSEYDGYGVLFPLGITARYESELASRREIKFSELESSHKLLKLHGSLNWLRRSDDGGGQRPRPRQRDRRRAT
jgi:hypothetical protein